MSDPRTEGLAKILVGYSTEVKPGEVVSIDGESAAAPLLLAVYEEVLKAGANPVLNVALDGQIAAYFKHASDAQLEWISPFAEWMVDHADVRIAIGASTNTRELSGVAPERQTLRQVAGRQAAGDDSRIRFDDIPRLTDEQLAHMVRLRDARPRKVAVSVRLDAQVLAWLKSKGEGHLTRINDILLNLMEAEQGH